MGSSDDRRSPRIGVLALAFAAVVGVALAGPVRVGEARWTPKTGYRMQPMPTNVGASLPPKPFPAPEHAASHLMGTILQIILLVVAAGIVVAIVVALLRRFRPRRLVRRAVTGDGDEVALLRQRSTEVVSAPEVVRALSRALIILDRPGDSRDAVVHAWLGLEEAAAESGAPRRVSETAAEHARRIVTRFDTDRAAADELLGLYQRARYGTHITGEADVRAARRCLERLRTSWHEAPERPAQPAEAHG